MLPLIQAKNILLLSISQSDTKGQNPSLRALQPQTSEQEPPMEFICPLYNGAISRGTGTRARPCLVKPPLPSKKCPCSISHPHLPSSFPCRPSPNMFFEHWSSRGESPVTVPTLQHLENPYPKKATPKKYPIAHSFTREHINSRGSQKELPYGF